MRKTRLLVLILSFSVASCTIFCAQEVTVSVGAVTKYSGIATNEKDIKDIKSINESLNTLESQLAREFVNHTEVEYLDRMNTEAIFRELHLSSNSTFDASSGALRGLLGRLDFLIVIDSADPSTARIRLLDVQSGAVKAIETCLQKSWLTSLVSQGPPECIGPFVTHSIAAMHAKKTAKEEQARQQAAADLATQKQIVADQKREQERASAEGQHQMEQAAAVAREQANAALEARQAAEREAADQAQITQRLNSMKPDLDDSIARLSAQNDFWRDLSQQLAGAGQSLRPSITSAMKAANTDAGRCKELYNARTPDDLQDCITRLNRDLDKLDKFKE